ncbi:histidine kinase [Pontibacter ruber]|uniref:Histidine kinase n=1 Tax=Pontibacter ruber TaxID=1343895 RepID=A0ABW5D2I6_9BACT|nr:histidine kinase [Pontibacter ruber]
MKYAHIDIQQLRIKHILFKSKVRSVLYGGTYDEAFFSSAGPIATWFSSVGFVKFGHAPEVLEMHKLHQELNTTAQQLFLLYKSNKIDQAHEGLKTIEKNSERFLLILARLEEQLGLAAAESSV